jgi:hypothetical protein
MQVLAGQSHPHSRIYMGSDALLAQSLAVPLLYREILIKERDQYTIVNDLLRSETSSQFADNVASWTWSISFHALEADCRLPRKFLHRIAICLLKRASRLRALSIDGDLSGSVVLHIEQDTRPFAGSLIKLDTNLWCGMPPADMECFANLRELMIQSSATWRDGCTSLMAAAPAWTLPNVMMLTLALQNSPPDEVASFCEFFARCRFDGLRTVRVFIKDTWTAEDTDYKDGTAGGALAIFFSHHMHVQAAEFVVPDEVLAQFVACVAAPRIHFSGRRSPDASIVHLLSPRVQKLLLEMTSASTPFMEGSIWTELGAMDMAVGVHRVTFERSSHDHLSWHVASEAD